MKFRRLLSVILNRPGMITDADIVITDADIEREFRFLIDAHGFTMGSAVSDSVNSAEVVFRAPALIIRSTFNERDSYDTELTPGVSGDGSFSIGTLLAALDRKRPTRFADPLKILKYQSQFVRSNLDFFQKLPEDVFADCMALRFWHAADLRRGWGKSISLSSDEIQREWERLRRLQATFTKPGTCSLP